MPDLGCLVGLARRSDRPAEEAFAHAALGFDRTSMMGSEIELQAVQHLTYASSRPDFASALNVRKVAEPNEGLHQRKLAQFEGHSDQHDDS